MGKFFNRLFGNYRESSVTLEEVNEGASISDFIYPMQHLMNQVHDITDNSGWDVDNWTINDINKFMEAVLRFGKRGDI
jgi:hypothetical protein